MKKDAMRLNTVIDTAPGLRLVLDGYQRTLKEFEDKHKMTTAEMLKKAGNILDNVFMSSDLKKDLPEWVFCWGKIQQAMGAAEHQNKPELTQAQVDILSFLQKSPCPMQLIEMPIGFDPGAGVMAELRMLEAWGYVFHSFASREESLIPCVTYCITVAGIKALKQVEAKQ